LPCRDDDYDDDDDVVGLLECGCLGASWKLIKRQSNFDNMQLGDLEKAQKHTKTYTTSSD